ncbi:MAG: hypothetical protein SWH61_06685 [Thermodesulfobacteriota bacterium]|nr:hypothetical protein [Thermodesulfobacteriota bacterium]
MRQFAFLSLKPGTVLPFLLHVRQDQYRKRFLRYSAKTTREIVKQDMGHLAKSGILQKPLTAAAVTALNWSGLNENSFLGSISSGLL